MIRRSRPALMLLAVLTALATVAGCAAIPDETPAAGLAAGGAGDRVAPAPDPQLNLQPADLVRAFLDANADPTNSYAAGRPYLTKAAQAKWQPDTPVTIIQNTFNTLPDQTKADHATVTVISQTVGVLGTDKAFVPSSSPSTLIVQVDKQDGQWRISQPPPGVVMTLDRFNEVYRQTRLYFLDPQKRVLVPDLRYIVSQPSSSLPGRVIDLLLAGPSNGMQGAVTSALSAQAALQTGATESNDGALLVNLSHVGDTSPANVKLIVAQIVQSLAVVTNSRIRIEQDGVALSPDRPDWRIGDLPAYDSGTSPGPDQTGLLVHDGRVKQLDDKPVNGPAGNGSYYVSTAAQSIDGSELATVSKPAGATGAELRVGGLTQVNPVVDLTASTLTRPTWVSTDSATDVSNEVWTVADGSRVARVIKSADGTWVARTVNSNDLSQFGQISDLRLSRDGTRAAVIANSLLIVCAVVRTPNSDTVTLRSPRVLLQDTLNSVVGVDWLLQDQLVVATSSQESPVVQVSVDGSPTFVRYNAANLTAPVSAVTAAPSRPVIVVDAGGMWSSSDSGSVWRVQGVAVGKSSNAVPFYPG